MRQSLYILVGGFLTGVVWRSFFDPGVVGVGLVLLVALTILVGIRSVPFHTRVYIVLFCFAGVLGVARTEFAFVSYIQTRTHMPPGFIQREAQVVAEPDKRGEYTILRLALDNPSGGGSVVHARAKVQPFPIFEYGAHVRVTGELVIPRTFESETGRTFDYPGYLMKEGIHYELKNAEVTLTGIRTDGSVLGQLLHLKHAWLTAVSRLIPEPNAALAGGLVVGAKQSLGERWLELFRITGIIHIVVLSGYNLTLIADSMVRACRRLPKRIGVLVGIFGIVGFASMAGASATVVRASVMAILVLLARHGNRPHTAMRLLTIAACGMVLSNPFVLVFDTGFQLSFLATLGLIYYAPLFEKWCRWVPERFQVRSIVAATLATQLIVVPLLLYQMGQVSLIAPLVNVLILPVIPFVMAATFVAGTIGLVFSPIALPIAWIASLLLSYVFRVVALCAEIPFAAVSFSPIPYWVIVLMYGALALVTYHFQNKTPREQVSRGVL